MSDHGLATLFTTYRDEVRRHVANKLGSEQDVEDLTQEVFLRVHRTQSTRTIEQPRPYLHQVAASVVADHYRRRQRRRPPASLDAIDDEAEVAGPAPTPEELVIGEQTWESLCAALDGLPARARQAVVLRKIEDRSCVEVADRMGISIRTLEKHLARGLRNLRASVDPGRGTPDRILSPTNGGRRGFRRL